MVFVWAAVVLCHLSRPCSSHLAAHTPSLRPQITTSSPQQISTPSPSPSLSCADLSHTHANAVRTYFAPDAVLGTPIYSTTGVDHIRDMINFHHALSTESAVGPIDWDDK